LPSRFCSFTTLAFWCWHDCVWLSVPASGRVDWRKLMETMFQQQADHPLYWPCLACQRYQWPLGVVQQGLGLEANRRIPLMHSDGTNVAGVIWLLPLPRVILLAFVG